MRRSAATTRLPAIGLAVASLIVSLIVGELLYRAVVQTRYEQEPHPQRTEQLLRARGSEVEVINAGIPGYNTEQEALLLDELMPKYQPDRVVLGYVVNDAEPQGNVPQPPSITYRYAHSWLWEDAELLLGRSHKLVTSVRYLDGFQPESPKWREPKAALGRIALACRRAAAPLLVLVLPDTTEPFDASYPYSLIHREVLAWSRELGIPAHDLIAAALRDQIAGPRSPTPGARGS